MSWDTELYEARHNFVWKMGEGVVELLAPRAANRSSTSVAAPANSLTKFLKAAQGLWVSIRRPA